MNPCISISIPYIGNQIDGKTGWDIIEDIRIMYDDNVFADFDVNSCCLRLMSEDPRALKEISIALLDRLIGGDSKNNEEENA